MKEKLYYEAYAEYLRDEAEKEKWSADVGSIKRAADLKYATEMLEEQTKKLAELETQAAAWKRRAEAAERELHGICLCCAHAVRIELLPTNDILYICDDTKKHGEVVGTEKRKCERWKWRGPCAENGGDTDEQS